MAVGRLASVKTSPLVGINTNTSLYLSSGHLSDVTVTVTNQGLDQAKYFIGISSGSLAVAKSSDYIIFNKPLERNESVSLNVGIKSGDLIFCRASKKDVTFLAYSSQDYPSRLSSSFGRENSIKITDSENEPNVNISLLTSTKELKTTLVVENNSFDSAFVSAGISSGGVSQFGPGDYLFYAKNLAPRESYTFRDIGIGINQSLIIRSSKTNVKFTAFSVPANPVLEGVGIQSVGFSIVGSGVTQLNFIGAGNTFKYNPSTNTLDISIQGGSSSKWITTNSGIHTLSNVGIATTNPLTPLQIEQVYGVKTGIGTFNAAAGVTTHIDSFNTSQLNFQSIEYTLHVGYGTYIQSEKVLVIQDGTTAYSQEYAVIYNSSLIVSVGATMSGTTCKLQVTPEAGVSGLATYRFVRSTLL